MFFPNSTLRVPPPTHCVVRFAGWTRRATHQLRNEPVIAQLAERADALTTRVRSAAAFELETIKMGAKKKEAAAAAAPKAKAKAMFSDDDDSEGDASDSDSGSDSGSGGGDGEGVGGGDADVAGGGDDELKINPKFAARFNHNMARAEMHRLQEKVKHEVIMRPTGPSRGAAGKGDVDSEDLSDSSDDDSDSDDGVLPAKQEAGSGLSS